MRTDPSRRRRLYFTCAACQARIKVSGARLQNHLKVCQQYLAAGPKRWAALAKKSAQLVLR